MTAQWYHAGLSIKILWVRIPPMAQNKYLSCARSPVWLSPFGWNENRISVAGVLHIELGLTIRVYGLRKWTVVSDCTGARVENDIQPARHKQYTNRHRICPSHRTTLLWLHSLCTPCRHAARSSKNNMWLLGIEYAKLSFHKKWNNCPHPTGLSSPNRSITIDRQRIHLWAWPWGFTAEI